MPLEVLGRHIKESILAQHVNQNLVETASKGVRS